MKLIYCNKNFWEDNKDKIRKTFDDLYGCHPMQSQYPKDVIDKTYDREWLMQQHHDLHIPISHICENELMGYDNTTIGKRFKDLHIDIKHLCSVSYPEKLLCNFLLDNNISYKSNTRNVILPYELDIHIPNFNIAIEFNGLFWHNERNKPYNYHYMKYQLCKNNGIRLIQIFEDEWNNNEKLIKNKLLHIMGLDSSRKIFARKTSIKIIDTKTKSNFFNKHHIQGNGPSSINYGLEHNNELVAVMGFIKNNDGSFTLNRYATSCSVVGGFSKLLTYFERQYNKPKIISFADLRWSEGDLYYKNGFVLDKILEPDYYWTKGINKWHKFNFRHVGMKTKLEHYDPTLSETDNMHNHGFYKIYDCGKLRFVKN